VLYKSTFTLPYRCCVLLTDVLKQYLRTLPEPLMTFDLYADWLAVSLLYVTCLRSLQLNVVVTQQSAI